MGTHPIFESDFDCLTDPFRATQKLKMRYVAAYLLAQLGGNAGPDADAIKAILSSVGVDADEEKLSKVISELAGKNIDDVLAEGKAKLASVPSWWSRSSRRSWCRRRGGTQGGGEEGDIRV